jgi:hypothetical protein
MHALCLLLLAQPAAAFPADPDMPAVVLPDLKLTTAADWQSKRRTEILEQFRDDVYGRRPDTPFTMTAQTARESKSALSGQATLKEIDILISARGQTLTIRLNLFTPNAATKPVPVFLLIGNRGIDAADPSRAKNDDFWPVEEGIARGVAMAVFQNSDVDADKDDHFTGGIHALLDAAPRTVSSWATLSAWGWGASRCCDVLIKEAAIDPKKIALIGHSRGGKSALWAAAEDDRFALVISNNSGCGGAAISRRKFAGKEQIARITKAFPHWFAAKFASFADNEAALPVDQHMLMALIAPRAVAVGSAFEDKWADPRGEFLSLVHAVPIYKLLGHAGLGTVTMPPAGMPIHGDRMHYHLRAGKHDLTLEDWNQYWDFADRVFVK